MNLAELGKLGIKDPFKKRYENFIGGKWVPPVKGEYFENVSPVIGHAFTEIARCTAICGAATWPAMPPARR